MPVVLVCVLPSVCDFCMNGDYGLLPNIAKQLLKYREITFCNHLLWPLLFFQQSMIFPKHNTSRMLDPYSWTDFLIYQLEPY
jgi:hypothetical protein